MLKGWVSNDMLRGPAGDAGLAEDFRQVAATGCDIAALYGQGTEHQPLGVVPSLHADNDNSDTGETEAGYVADLEDAATAVKAANIAMINPGWILHPTRASKLRKLRASGLWVFRDEMKDGTLNGFPYRETTSCTETDIIFGSWGHFIWGQDTAFTLSEHPDTRAEYDETLVRGVLRLDFQRRHQKAFYRINYA